jgi:U3 small nucleolar RNA-associated protein 13
LVYQVPGDDSSASEPIAETRRTSRAHESVVHVAVFDASSKLIASGSADGIVKVWDVQRGYATHLFKSHGGVISSLVFHQYKSTNSLDYDLQLITACVDCRVRIFQLTGDSSKSATSKPVAVLEGHTSVPRSLNVSLDGQWLVTAGRDGVALVWKYPKPDPKSGAHAPTKTIPLFERVESLSIISSNSTSSGLQGQFCVGGEKGVVSLWDVAQGSVVKRIGTRFQNQCEIVTMQYV